MTNKITMSTRIALTAGIVAAGLAATTQGETPSHPDQLVYAPTDFTPPEPGQFRTELDGIPVFLAESSELPLVSISFSFKGGSYMAPAGKAGLGGLTGALIRTGGTADMTPEAIDEEFAFLAANVGAHIGDTSSGASLNCLSSNLDEAFGLFMDMVRQPAFNADRFEVMRDDMIEGMKQRNDDGMSILLREWGTLMFGDHFAGREPTGGSVGSITVDDMKALHAEIFHPGNLIIAVTGDFDRADMLDRLGKAIAGWDRLGAAPTVPEPTHTFTPGIYHAEKDQPQSQVIVGQRGIKRDHPDAIAVRMMNDILGGGGFTSRITNRVRTDEGLAYSAGSVFRNRVDYDGDFLAYFFSKNPTVPLAARTVKEELVRIRDFEVTTDELDTVKNNMIETFPRTFESKAGTLGVFVSDEMTNRPPGFWQGYRDRVGGVSPEDVQRVARERLDPDNMMMLIVGPWKEVSVGNKDSEADPGRVVTMDDIGEVIHLPARDPLTLEIVEGE